MYVKTKNNNIRFAKERIIDDTVNNKRHVCVGLYNERTREI